MKNIKIAGVIRGTEKKSIKKQLKGFRFVLKRYRKLRRKIKKKEGKEKTERIIRHNLGNIHKLRILQSQVHAIDRVYGETAETRELKEMIQKDIEKIHSGAKYK